VLCVAEFLVLPQNYSEFLRTLPPKLHYIKENLVYNNNIIIIIHIITVFSLLEALALLEALGLLLVFRAL
jgi:hypothetical protein